LLYIKFTFRSLTKPPPRPAHPFISVLPSLVDGALATAQKAAQKEWKRRGRQPLQACIKKSVNSCKNFM